jgi:hypothetical protein
MTRFNGNRLSSKQARLPTRFMNALPRRIRKTAGSVLVTTLVLALLVGIVAGALLVITRQQNVLTVRSQTWSSEIPVAEAGIEEAMAHLNSGPTNFASRGWSSSGSNFFKTNGIGNDSAYYYTTISTANPPTIVSIGYGRIPLSTSFTHRTVMVTTKKNFASGGVIAKGKITMSGGASVDSFDSSDPTYSSNGVYTISKRHDQAYVGSASSLAPAVDSGTGKIYGNAATAPGGTVAGTVGDGTWNASNTGLQTGHTSDDFNMAIPDAAIPSDFGSGLPLPAVNALGQYILVGGLDYKVSASLSVPGGKSLLVTGPGKVRLWVTGDFTLSGSAFAEIQTGADFELYIGGKGTISGGGIMNDTQNASHCAVYGLPTCTTMTYSGSAAYIGTVYAPQAAFTFSGGAGGSGSFVANTVTISGSAGVHYDEALGRPTAPYSIMSWEEL